MKFIVISLVTVMSLALAATAIADLRAYVWTYEYLTMEQGELELEHYLDFRAPEWGDNSLSFWSQQVELEYGVTDRWDVALYQVFTQTNSDNYRHDQIKLRTRYRLLEKGTFFVDPLLYLEYKRPTDASEANILEGKLILARDLEPVSLAGNLILEKELVSSSKWVTEYAGGANFGISEKFKAGIEGVGNFKSGNQNDISLGPTIAFKSDKFSFSTGVMWGLNMNSDDFKFRYILGLEL